MKSPFPLKPLFSPFVAVGFVVISVTGIMLFFHVKNGPIMMLHEWFGWAFVGAGTIHALLNWRPLFAYLRQRCALASLGLALILVVALFFSGYGNKRQQPGGHPGERPATEVAD